MPGPISPGRRSGIWFFSLDAAAEAEHPPWPLCQVEALGLDQDLLQHAGLPAPYGDPLAHASRGVPVRIGMWHW